MKIINKGIALTLALLMILAIGISASAADAPTKGRITIQKTLGDYGTDMFNIYLLFEATEAFDEAGNLTAVSYTCTDAQKAIINASDYFTADEANNVSATDDAIVVDEATGEVSLSAGAVQWIKANIDKLGTLKIPEWQDDWYRLSNEQKEKTPYYSQDSYFQSTDYIIENLPFGYYYIDSTVGSLVMINTAEPNKTIVDKNGIPSMTKIISDVTNSNGEHSGQIYNDGKLAEAQIGDTVTYTITVTAMPGAEQYILSDSMNWGLTLDPDPQNISIKAGPPVENPEAYTTLVSGTDYTLLTDTGTGYTFRPADADQGIPAAIGKGEGDTFTPAHVFPEGFSDSIRLASRFYNDYPHEYPSYFWPDEDYLTEHNIPNDYGAQIVVLFDQDYLDTITEPTNIVLTYNATPNATLIETYMQPYMNNSAFLNYGHIYEIRDTAAVISWQLMVYKYEGDGESIIPVVEETDPAGDGTGSTGDDISFVEATPLDGVKFMLKRADGKYLKYILRNENDPNSLAITWVDIEEAQPTELVTGPCNIWVQNRDKNGRPIGPPTLETRHGYIVVNGLVPGTYTLEETAPKPGYNRAQPTTFSLPPKNIGANWRYQVNIPNKPGTVLPTTGGTGTAIYYLLGFTVLLSGTALLLRRREKAAGEQ